jgi:hypothetical protein
MRGQTYSAIQVILPSGRVPASSSSTRRATSTSTPQPRSA